MPTNGQEIFSSFELPKGSKTTQKCPFYPFLATQEAVFGELTFGGENGHQILKFYLF